MNLENNYRESIIPIYNDPYAVSTMKRREAVGHVPCKISRMCAILKLAETSTVLKQETAVILVTYPRNSHRIL